VSDVDLSTALLDLHHQFSRKKLRLILGGGFGLFLKQIHLLEQPAVRTLLPIESWPQPRSTADLDIFFPLELLIDLSQMQAVRKIIDEMKFEPVTGSRYWKFAMPGNRVKLDLLTGPVDSMAHKLKADLRRVRPKGNVQLHAHPVPEALDLSLSVESIDVLGQLSNGKKYAAKVDIPSPFTYLMMKVTAYGDQYDNPDKNQGRHHALDIYRIIAMLTEPQFEQTKIQMENTRIRNISYACGTW